MILSPSLPLSLSGVIVGRAFPVQKIFSSRDLGKAAAVATKRRGSEPEVQREREGELRTKTAERSKAESRERAIRSGQETLGQRPRKRGARARAISAAGFYDLESEFKLRRPRKTRSRAYTDGPRGQWRDENY